MFHFSQVLLIYYTRHTRFIRFCVILIRAAHPRRTRARALHLRYISYSGREWMEYERAHQLLCPFHASQKERHQKWSRRTNERESERLFSCACLLSNYWNSSLLRSRFKRSARQVISFDLLCGER